MIHRHALLQLVVEAVAQNQHLMREVVLNSINDLRGYAVEFRTE